MVDFQSRNSGRRSPSDGADADSPTPEAERTEDVSDASSEARSGLFVLTVETDETTEETAEAIVRQLEVDGRSVVGREVVDPGYDAVQAAINRSVSRGNVDAVISVGGTGVGAADATVEAVEPLLDKGLPGFGELFRVGYHERVGTDVIGMRPIAGVSEGVPVFCLPGDQDAATFAVEELLLGSLDDLIADAVE